MSDAEVIALLGRIAVALEKANSVTDSLHRAVEQLHAYLPRHIDATTSFATSADRLRADVGSLSDSVSGLAREVLSMRREGGQQ